MNPEGKLRWLPAFGVLFLMLLAGPFFLVQALPESVTQKFKQLVPLDRVSVRAPLVF